MDNVHTFVTSVWDEYRKGAKAIAKKKPMSLRLRLYELTLYPEILRHNGNDINGCPGPSQSFVNHMN